MSVDAQKLELITWINSLDDKRLLDELYLQVKKTMESRQADSPAQSVIGEKATSESPQPAPGSPLQLLEQIVDAYASLDEPDLNATQIFRDRVKADCVRF